MGRQAAEQAAYDGTFLAAYAIARWWIPDVFFLARVNREWSNLMNHLRVSLVCGAVGLCGAGGCYKPLACGFESEAGACLTVVTVAPYSSILDTQSANVDAFRGQCEVPDPVNDQEWMLEPEPFQDHLAVIAVSNEAPIDAVSKQDAPAVTLNQYAVEYVLNDCGVTGGDVPTAATCPSLDPIERHTAESTTIRAGEKIDITIPMVPLRKKFEYRERGGNPFAIPSYTAVLHLYGFDAEGEASLEGSTEFTIGDFDSCPMMESSNFPF
ncbi:hypothetical protein ACFL6C_04565 [Myxococcota bacterium]